MVATARLSSSRAPRRMTATRRHRAAGAHATPNPTVKPLSNSHKTSILARLAGPALTVGLMAGACYLLYRSLKDVELWKLWHELHEFPPASIALSIGLTALSYLALTTYDYIGVRYIKRKIAYRRGAAGGGVGSFVQQFLGLIGGWRWRRVWPIRSAIPWAFRR